MEPSPHTQADVLYVPKTLHASSQFILTIFVFINEEIVAQNEKLITQLLTRNQTQS